MSRSGQPPDLKNYDEYVWTEIAKRLDDGESLAMLAVANKWFHRVVNDDIIWKHVCLRQLDRKDPGPVRFKWNEVYKSAFGEKSCNAEVVTMSRSGQPPDLKNYDEYVWTEIAKRLDDGESLAMLSVANKWFHRVVNDDIIWKHVCLRQLDRKDPGPVRFKWNEVYKSAFGEKSYNAKVVTMSRSGQPPDLKNYDEYVWTEIAKRLDDGESLAMLAVANKWFHRVVNDDIIWKHVCLRQLDRKDPGPVRFKWNEVYKSAFGEKSYNAEVVTMSRSGQPPDLKNYDEYVWTEIAKHLDAKSLAMLAVANKWFHRVVMNDIIWKHVCLRQLDMEDPGPVSFKWNELYNSAYGEKSYNAYELFVHFCNEASQSCLFR